MNTDKSIKTFKDLQLEVIKEGRCSKCGGCISFCSTNRLHALTANQLGFPEFADPQKCMECGICYLICPQIPEMDEKLRETFGPASDLGAFKTVLSMRATDPAIRKFATDGGVVSALLLFMLDRKLIEGAIVSKKIGLFSRESIIATTKEEIIEAAGSHFEESSHLKALGDQYSTFTSSLYSLKTAESRNLLSLAMVGTPCQVNTLRKMQLLGIAPSHLISYVLGLFCWENFTFDDLAKKRFESRLQINLDEIAKMNIKDDFIITLTNGITIHIPLEAIDEIARPACFYCTDFSNYFSDVVFGGLGSPDGYTTVLVRTDKGAKLISEAMRLGYIEERKYETISLMRAAKAFLIAKIVQFNTLKEERARNKIKECCGL